jgi:hypothetical protein
VARVRGGFDGEHTEMDGIAVRALGASERTFEAGDEELLAPVAGRAQ